MSAAFDAGGSIPKRHTCDDANLSPPLSWSGVPAGTEVLALLVDDPDAPRKTFSHWVAVNIPPDYNGNVLSEGMRFGDEDGILEGVNDFGSIGYSGPCPPRGSTHMYVLRLFALDARLDVESGASREQVTSAMEGHILAEANLSASFAR